MTVSTRSPLLRSQLALQTARADCGRAGTIRAGATALAQELKESNGEIIWDRLPQPALATAQGQPGDPTETPAAWTHVRESL